MNKNTNNFNEENKGTLVYEGGNEYYQYLKDMKNENTFENSEYSTSFMML